MVIQQVIKANPLLFFRHVSNLTECLYSFQLGCAQILILHFYYRRGHFQLLVRELHHIRQMFHYFYFYCQHLTIAMITE